MVRRGRTVVGVVTALLLSAAVPVEAAPAMPATAAELRDQLIRMAPRGSTALVDPATGRVIVRVPAAVPANVASVIARSRGRAAAVPNSGGVELLSGVIGGHEIDARGGGCTAGFIALDGDGNDYIVTAGHCGDYGGSWRRNGKALGNWIGGVLGYDGDFGLVSVVRNFDGEPRVSAIINGANNVRFVRGIAGVPMDLSRAVCMRGRNTGYRCGHILGWNVVSDTTVGPIAGLIMTDICATYGDSGAPLYTVNPFDQDAWALGVLSNASTHLSCADPNYRSYFQPIGEALDYWGLALMTV